ncbi:hypothetical protein BATDEDRAFT_89598 [Batrachochytrium dendrobatidis JAM81]|uniref:Non-structural maintenance of chromosomes element 1 homolog n=1 Tax=Batrachochytrium dendrobatidis (strain JAM81 / FGSC 10211) TaxID=684364 RepID=F4P623_BATDJ|nr:uncharacterized protein BATDEDRAFT_89598 [Batrachochytrium dendrobatidis JAM81]EGF79527.1 hypothetical protein BATDEDRAFT_89598 [Batrachochytrium dendrobatidis JAM81]|eukprot:XP_006680190.1 hypothetical protein BATDEDRAFT_89598 [Batrachochytrium dendrobatidis JAM81]
MGVSGYTRSASSLIADVDIESDHADITEHTLTNESTYGDVHRMFLQGLMVRQVMTVTDATELYTKIAQQEKTSMLGLAAFVNQINAELGNKVGLEVKRGIDPNTGKDTLVLINIHTDELAQLAAAYTPSEVSFFKKMIELLIVEKSNGLYELSSLKALRAASHVKPALTKENAEMLISRLVQDNWLLDRNGKLTLGVRSIFELRPYLLEEYPEDIFECSSCFQILTTNTTQCANNECNVALHQHCVFKVFGDRAIRNCYKCTTPWPVTLEHQQDQTVNNHGESIEENSAPVRDQFTQDKDEVDTDCMSNSGDEQIVESRSAKRKQMST